MLPHSNTARWSFLEANAHRPDVQEQIRDAIRAGTIRVIPEGAGVKIVPTGAARIKAGGSVITPNMPGMPEHFGSEPHDAGTEPRGLRHLIARPVAGQDSGRVRVVSPAGVGGGWRRQRTKANARLAGRASPRTAS